MSISNNILGYASIGGSSVRCTACSITLDKKPLFYETIIGLRDSIPSSLYANKSDSGALNKQRNIKRDGVGLYRCSISYFVGESEPLFGFAKNGGEFDINYNGVNGDLLGLNKCRVNSYTFSVSAGDIATVSAEILAIEAGSSGNGSIPSEGALSAWDDYSISVGSECDLQSFSFTINNNCKPIYTSTNLFPLEIRVGTQMVNGTYASYDSNSSGTTISMSGDLSVSFNVSSAGMGLATSSSGPVINQYHFEAHDYSLGQ
jgi:hypothetical protein